MSYKQPWSSSPYNDILRQAGLRPTRPRVQIAELLFAKGDRHVTAETLYGEAKANRYPPSLATIYNALRDFAAHGLVREIALYGSTIWYDTKVGPHFHYYIEGEGREELSDIPDVAIPSFYVPTPAGMRVVGIDVVVRLAPVETQSGERMQAAPLAMAAE